MSARINSNHTPKKVKPKRKNPDTVLSPLNVTNLPGRKKLKVSMTTTLATTTKKTTGKCQICGIIYESIEDKALRKKKGT